MSRLLITSCHIIDTLIESSVFSFIPGSRVKVALLLITGALNSDTLIAHRTLVPLFTDVAGTVRLDCTVPEDGSVTVVISRANMSG